MKNESYVLWPGWQTVRLIGRGSFGAVYEIQRDVFGEVEKAALKVISIPQNASDIEEMHNDGYDDESITKTFEGHMKSIVSEYSLMRKMNGCPNIVSCDDVRYIQHDDGIGWDIFIKMDLLTPLTKALPTLVSEGTVVKIAKDLCNALEVCKEHNVVHRDIKPQNIFVSRYGDYKLGDFGIAKTVEKTMGGTKIGTYKYMAPEVYNNQPYGAAADIYSLGLVLYWLLNERRMPFVPLPPAKLDSGKEEESRLRRFSGEKLPAPQNGSGELKKIVLKACAYDPKNRYASASEMLNALERAYGLAEEDKTVGLFYQNRTSKTREEENSRARAQTVFADGEGSARDLAEKENPSAKSEKAVITGTPDEDQSHESCSKAKAKHRKLWIAAGIACILLVLVSIATITMGNTNRSEQAHTETENTINQTDASEPSCEQTDAMPDYPIITKQPSDAYADEGQRISVTIEAEGDGLSYEWWFAPANSDEFSMSSISSAFYSTVMNSKVDGRRIYCIITDAFGNKTQSDTVTLNRFTDEEKPIVITKQPVSTTAKENETVVIVVDALGDGLQYQWWFVPNDEEINFEKTSVTTNTYIVTMSSECDGRNIVCVITDRFGNTQTTDIVTIKMIEGN